VYATTVTKSNLTGHVFNNPLFSKIWFTTFSQPNWHLATFAFFDQKSLIAIAPFYIQKSKYFFMPTKLYPLTQGESEDAEIATEYCDILITPGYEEQVLTELSKKLKSLKFDQIIWRAALSNSNIVKLLNKTYDIQTDNSHARYIIERSNWSLESLRKNTRSRYRRSLNQLHKIKATFCWVDENKQNEYIDKLSTFHQIRWEKKGETGAFFHPDFRIFHQQLRQANPRNIVISAICIDSQPIAINYYLTDKETLYFYQCGWDEVNHSKFSLGMALHIWSIEHCNHKYYDFMMGGLNDSYKQKFGCEQIPMTNIVLNITPWKIFLSKVIHKIKILFIKNH